VDPTRLRGRTAGGAVADAPALAESATLPARLPLPLLRLRLAGRARVWLRLLLAAWVCALLARSGVAVGVPVTPVAVLPAGDGGSAGMTGCLPVGAPAPKPMGRTREDDDTAEAPPVDSALPRVRDRVPVVEAVTDATTELGPCWPRRPRARVGEKALGGLISESAPAPVPAAPAPAVAVILMDGGGGGGRGVACTKKGLRSSLSSLSAPEACDRPRRLPRPRAVASSSAPSPLPPPVPWLRLRTGLWLPPPVAVRRRRLPPLSLAAAARLARSATTAATA
jgi:hypothetical protein